MEKKIFVECEMKPLINVEWDPDTAYLLDVSVTCAHYEDSVVEGGRYGDGGQPGACVLQDGCAGGGDRAHHVPDRLQVPIAQVVTVTVEWVLVTGRKVALTIVITFPTKQIYVKSW